MKNVFFLPKVDSTNNYAAKLLTTENWADPSVILTFNQTQGRGQRGNSWSQEPGKDLAISFLCKLNGLPVSKSFTWAMWFALTVCDFLRQTYCPDILLKWPNDIFYGDKKLGGILIENQLVGKTIATSIAGLGLNIKQTKEHTAQSISLEKIVGRSVSLEAVSEELMDFFRAQYATKFLDFTVLRPAYYQRLLGFGETRKFAHAQLGTLTGKVLGVSELGLLQLLTKEHGSLEFDIKEIIWCF